MEDLYVAQMVHQRNEDILESCHRLTEILGDEIKSLSRDRAGTALRLINNMFGAAPRARSGHYSYGMLDLIQGYGTMPLSEELNHKIVKVCLRVAEGSPHSYLRCKAFEVLAKFWAKLGIMQMIDQMICELLERDALSEHERWKISREWEVAKTMTSKVELEENLLVSVPCCLAS